MVDRSDTVLTVFPQVIRSLQPIADAVEHLVQLMDRLHGNDGASLHKCDYNLDFPCFGISWKPKPNRRNAAFPLVSCC